MTTHLIALACLFLLMLALLAWAFWPHVKAWTQDAGRGSKCILCALARAVLAPSPASRVRGTQHVDDPYALSPESHHAGLYADILRRREQRDRQHNSRVIFYAMIVGALAATLIVRDQPPPNGGPAIVERDGATLVRVYTKNGNGCMTQYWIDIDTARMPFKTEIC